MKLTGKALLIFAAIFAAGMIAGGALSLRWAPHPPPRNMGQKPPSLEQFGKMHLAMLSQRLKLTEQQKTQITPIFKKADAALRQLRVNGFKQTNAILNEMDGEIRTLLTPEQSRKLDEMRKRQNERFRTFVQPGPPPPPMEKQHSQGQSEAEGPRDEHRPGPAQDEPGDVPEQGPQDQKI